MSPLSIDLRSRIIRAWQKERLGAPELASRFTVGTATVKRLIRRFRETGSVEPRPHGGGQRPKIPAEKLPRVQQLLEANPDWSVEEFTAAYNRQDHVKVSRSTMDRAVRRAGFTRKKVPRCQGTQHRTHCGLARGLPQDDRRHRPFALVFVDETGTHSR